MVFWIFSILLSQRFYLEGLILLYKGHWLLFSLVSIFIPILSPSCSCCIVVHLDRAAPDFRARSWTGGLKNTVTTIYATSCISFTKSLQKLFLASLQKYLIISSIVCVKIKSICSHSLTTIQQLVKMGV